MSNDLAAMTEAAEAPVVDAPAPADLTARLRKLLPFFVVAIIALDAIAFFAVPPHPKEDLTAPITGIGDLINANLEVPPPAVLVDFAPGETVASDAILSFHPSITNTIVTTWIVLAIVLVLLLFVSRQRADVPRGLQNFMEWTWESLENWAVSLGGAPARPHVPLFVAFFLFILLSNWSGLLPIFGKIEALRAPTSDVNVTIGLALVAFVYFQGQGFRRLGIRGYLGKFFVFSGFREGPAAGGIALFVGLIEFMLEFIKPITLAMRLFGNIFGGELAIGVITALTIAIVPVALLGLEVLLNFVQALIFSVLTLMYTLIAIESHEEEEHAAPVFANDPEGNLGPPLAGMEPAAHH